MTHPHKHTDDEPTTTTTVTQKTKTTLGVTYSIVALAVMLTIAGAGSYFGIVAKISAMQSDNTLQYKAIKDEIMSNRKQLDEFRDQIRQELQKVREDFRIHASIDWDLVNMRLWTTHLTMQNSNVITPDPDKIWKTTHPEVSP